MKEKRHVLTGGLMLIALGVLLFLHHTSTYSFDQTWPILLVVIAVGVLLQRVRDLGGWIIGLVGCFFLVRDLWQVNVRVLTAYALPAFLVLLGIVVVLRNLRK